VIRARWIGLMIVLAWPAHAQAQLALQQAIVTNGSGGSSVTTIACTAGSSIPQHALIVVLARAAASETPTVDDTVNTFTLDVDVTNAGAARLRHWSTINATAGAHTFTITVGAAQTQLSCAVLVFTGNATSSFFDGDGGDLQTSDGAGVSLNAGDITTTNADDVLVTGLASSGNEVVTAPTNFQAATTATGGRLSVSYRIVSATDTYSAVWGLDGNADVAGSHAAYKQDGAAPVPKCHRSLLRVGC
jgi:hypothetical protein